MRRHTYAHQTHCIQTLHTSTAYCTYTAHYILYTAYKHCTHTLYTNTVYKHCIPCTAHYILHTAYKHCTQTHCIHAYMLALFGEPEPPPLMTNVLSGH